MADDGEDMSGNGYVTREKLLSFSGREFRDETFPGFGKLRIQSLSDGERRELQSKSETEFGTLDPEKAKWRFADRAIAQLVDPESDLPMFGEMDREALANLRPSITDPIYAAMVNFQGGTLPELDHEELKKSSETTPGSTESTS